jgi:general secretion pathway protein C
MGSLIRLVSLNDNLRMQTYPHSIWPLRITTFTLAALAAASAAYWVLNGVSVEPSAPVATLSVSGPVPVDSQAVVRLLGGGVGAKAASPAMAAPSRYTLTGVVAGNSRRGYALISVDGQPAKPFRVGSPVDDALVLQSVSARSAALGATRDAPQALTLDLPPLAPR